MSKSSARSESFWTRLRERGAARPAADDSPWDGNTAAWLASLLFHLSLLIATTLVVTSGVLKEEFTPELTSVPPEDDLLTTSEEFSYSDMPAEAVGSSGGGDTVGLFGAAPALALPENPTKLDTVEQKPLTDRFAFEQEIRVATTGPKFTENLVVKGAPGVGALGATGAIDRITQEIINSLEERRTLVVWLFDQSGSLEKQRGETIKRLETIYKELGVIEASGNPAFKKHDDKPLLTSIVAFGDKISFLTPKPTDEFEEIRSAVATIKTDASGFERTFQAVTQAMERFRHFRTQEPRRNVMLVLFTDEVGDDEAELDRTVAMAQRLVIPIYCVGVPAPFGLRDVAVKYIDPDPKFDQSPQWPVVRQGPESMMPELVKIGDEKEEAMDSGFGPYSLTRLCYETGGIFFAVHPNRKEGKRVSAEETGLLSARLAYFFDPQLMRDYRPDYVPAREYQKLLSENKARGALVQAAQMSWLTPMERPTLVFPKENDAQLANLLTRAQQAAAVLEPKVEQLYNVLKQGERDRPRLSTPRWQAGYDLSMGRVLALKVRTESYNAMLAKAKQGLRFENAKNDTWRLTPANEITVGSQLEKQAQQAKTYLKRVVDEHAGTPWALLAERELKDPLGWKWQETYTGVNAPRQVAGNGGNGRPPRDEKAKMIPRPERRPPPKL